MNIRKIGNQIKIVQKNSYWEVCSDRIDGPDIMYPSKFFCVLQDAYNSITRAL